MIPFFIAWMLCGVIGAVTYEEPAPVKVVKPVKPEVVLSQVRLKQEAKHLR